MVSSYLQIMTMHKLKQYPVGLSIGDDERGGYADFLLCACACA